MIWIGGLIRKGKGMNEKGKWMKYEGGTTKKGEMNEWIGGLIRKWKWMNKKGKWIIWEGGINKKMEMNEWEGEMNDMRKGD